MNETFRMYLLRHVHSAERAVEARGRSTWDSVRLPAMVVLIAALGWVVTAQVLNLADRLPEYEHNIVRKVERLRNKFAGQQGGIAEKLEHAAKEIQEATTRPAAQPASQPTTEPSATQQSATQQSATQPAAAAAVNSAAGRGGPDVVERGT
jgi:TolA-binding protein